MIIAYHIIITIFYLILYTQYILISYLIDLLSLRFLKIGKIVIFNKLKTLFIIDSKNIIISKIVICFSILKFKKFYKDFI